MPDAFWATQYAYLALAFAAFTSLPITPAWLAAIGRRTMGIYLLHQPLVLFLAVKIFAPLVADPFALYALAWAASAGFGLLGTLLVERFALGRFLLEPHAARWKAAREAHCDREAVLDGAEPLSLADAIVRAARPSAREVAALGAHDASVLSFRVRMLLAFAERAPVRCCREGRSMMPLAIALLAGALVLPHHAGADALDVLHSGAEQALVYLWR